MKDDTSNALHLAAGYRLESYGNLELKSLAEMECSYVEMVISICDGNVPKAAEILHVSPSTIYRKKAQWEGS